VRRLSVPAVALIFALPLLGPLPAVSADADFVVVAHPEIQGDELPRVILSAIFLRKAPRWEDGTDVRPVDHSMSSPLRAAFTEAVLDVPYPRLQRYWNDEIKNGTEPPPVKRSDSDVLAYVASTRGAIGYVSADTQVPDDVKTLRVVD
jgi:ABC-type phosphate transport system substrate-binding protein